MKFNHFLSVKEARKKKTLKENLWLVWNVRQKVAGSFNKELVIAKIGEIIPNM